MPMIYLKHPKHGIKIAMAEMEAVHDELSGWTRYDPMNGAEPVAPVLNDGPVGRRGRPRNALRDMEG